MFNKIYDFVCSPCQQFSQVPIWLAFTCLRRAKQLLVNDQTLLMPCSCIAHLLDLMLIQCLVVSLILPALGLCAWTSWARLRKERKEKTLLYCNGIGWRGLDGPNPEGESGGGQMAWDSMTLMLSVELPNICFRETCSWLCIYMSNACSADCSAMQLILLIMHPSNIWSRLLDSHVDMKGNRMGNCANMSY